MTSTIDSRARYTALARANEAHLLRVASRLCRRNHDQAQDLVQDALIRGFRAYSEGQFEDGTNAKAWLTKVLTNAFLNSYRSRNRREVDLDLDTAEQIVAREDGSSPDLTFTKDLLDEPLQRALNALPEPQRLCVILVDLQGMDYAEAALLLDVPIGTVRSRLARARMQLHELLYEYAKSRRLI